MGRVLGGGSSINGMVWARGHKNDFDYWAKEAGDSAWDYNHILEIYKRIEDWQGPADPSRRGAGGTAVKVHSTFDARGRVVHCCGPRPHLGAPDKTAIYTIRDLHDRVREVKVVRKVEYKVRGSTVGDRTGEVLRLLPGNIGYADLDLRGRNAQTS